MKPSQDVVKSPNSLHIFRCLCLAYFLLDLIIEILFEGYFTTLFTRAKYLNCWGISLATLYFYWVVSFEPSGPSSHRNYSSFVLNLQALTISVLSGAFLIYWLTLHRINPEDSGYLVFKKCSQHVFPALLIIADFVYNDIPILSKNRQGILPFVIFYLIANLYFTISEEKPVYRIITWDDFITPLVFVMCVAVLYVSFFSWKSVSERMKSKIKMK